MNTSFETKVMPKHCNNYRVEHNTRIVNKTSEHTQKKTKRYTATAKAWVYVYGCIELCSVQFYVSSESSECQRTRDKGNFHEHKKSQQQWQLQQKKEKKAKFFNGTVKYIMQSRRFILCMRKKSSLPVLYTRIDRQSGDAPTVVVDCWSTHAEPTKQLEQMKSGKRKSRAHDDKRICDIIIGLRGKLAPRKSISLTQREKNVAKIHVHTYGQAHRGWFSLALCVYKKPDAKKLNAHTEKKSPRWWNGCEKCTEDMAIKRAKMLLCVPVTRFNETLFSSLAPDFHWRRFRHAINFHYIAHSESGVWFVCTLLFFPSNIYT